MIADKAENETFLTQESAPWIDKVLGSNSHALEAAQRLRAAIDRIGGNKGVMARTGIPSRTLSGYLAGVEMRRPAVVALAKACGVNVAWLAAGEGQMVGEAKPILESQKFEEPQKSEPQHTFKAAKIIDHARLASCLDSTKELFDNAGRSPSTQDIVEVALTLYGDIDTL